MDQSKDQEIDKVDIINLLGQVNGYSSYLEVASQTTGHQYARVCEHIFTTKKRLLYNIPDGYSDGLPVDYSASDLSGSHCLEQIEASNQSFDVVFIDPYHTYKSSLQNLMAGFRLLNPDGVMVVHDCNPPSLDIASPTFQGGLWCGLTYLAFLDFVHQNPGTEYGVVDTDWGVGLVFRNSGTRPALFGPLPERPAIDGLQLGDWEVFDAQRQHLLRLLSPQCFRRIFANGRSAAQPKRSGKQLDGGTLQNTAS